MEWKEIATPLTTVERFCSGRKTKNSNCHNFLSDLHCICDELNFWNRETFIKFRRPCQRSRIGMTLIDFLPLQDTTDTTSSAQLQLQSTTSSAGSGNASNGTYGNFNNRYNCIKITNRKNRKGFFSNISHEMMI